MSDRIRQGEEIEEGISPQAEREEALSSSPPASLMALVRDNTPNFPALSGDRFDFAQWTGSVGSTQGDYGIPLLLGWGVNEDYQLGLENPADQSRPKVLDSMLGIRLSGRSFLSRPIVAGSRHSLAIDAYGQVFTWGWNARGTLGHGHRNLESKPKKIMTLANDRVRIVQAAIGGWHCLAVSDEGHVYAWGGNEYEQCALDGTERDIIRPVRVLPQMRARHVSAGGMHSVALTHEGEVWTWGEPWGEFALNLTRKPRRVDGLHRVIKTACGSFHNLALTADGTLFAWGTNDYGQLGSGDTSYSNVARPVVGLEGVHVVDISCGGWHSACITDQGEVFIWGRGEYGRLGLGDRSGCSKLRPLRVDGLLGHVVTEVSCGGTHTLCLTQEGRVFVFGRADYGRLGLGDGVTKDLYVPMEVPMPGGNSFWKVISVSAGGRHSICLALPDRSDEETDRRSSRQTTCPGSISEMVPLEDLASTVQDLSLGAFNNTPGSRGTNGQPRRNPGAAASGTAEKIPTPSPLGASPAPLPYRPSKSAEDLNNLDEEDEEGDWTAPVLGALRTPLDDMIDEIAGVDPSSTLIVLSNAGAEESEPPTVGRRSNTDLMSMASSGESIQVPSDSPQQPLSPIRSNGKRDDVALIRTHVAPGMGGAIAVGSGSNSPRPPPGPSAGKAAAQPAQILNFYPPAKPPARTASSHPPPARRISAIQMALERSGELDGHEEVDEDVNEF